MKNLLYKVIPRNILLLLVLITLILVLVLSVYYLKDPTTYKEDTLKYFYYIFTQIDKSKDRLFTILFGLTAGILTLVGLISIFVSIDSQHKLQKARELYWDMDVMKKYNNISQKNFEELYYLFYKILNDNNLESYTNKIIRLSRTSLKAVIYLWSLTPIIMLKSEKSLLVLIIIVTAVVLSILIRFYYFLEGLQDIKKVSGLSNPKLFVDGTKDDEDSIFWFSSSLKLNIKRSVGGELITEIITPFNFHDFKIKSVIRGESFKGVIMGLTYYTEDNLAIDYDNNKSVTDSKKIIINNKYTKEVNIPKRIYGALFISNKTNREFLVNFNAHSPYDEFNTNVLLDVGWEINSFKVTELKEQENLGQIFRKFETYKSLEAPPDKLNETLGKILSIFEKIEKN